jgi:dihydropteroate synthase
MRPSARSTTTDPRHPPSGSRHPYSNAWPVLDCAGKALDLTHPRVMGVLNVTPDSFSDGGRFTSREAALSCGLGMVEDGAALIDVGGESTRPGAASVQEELDRVIPVVEVLSAESPVPISIDTSKAEVMREAVAAGAGMINDVRALRGDGALAAAAELGVPVCLMHMRGEPRSMQKAPRYDDVVAEVKGFLRERVDAAAGAGLPPTRLVIDPGFGFGKALGHNLWLLKHLADFQELGLPLLVGVSRKSMIGAILGIDDACERLYGSVGLAVYAALQGAAIVRAHDVGPTVQALGVCEAVLTADEPGAA